MRLLILIILISISIGCSPKVKQATEDTMSSVSLHETLSYQDTVDSLRQVRLDRLTSPQGWLSVVGLHWLDQGINSIGAADDNTIQFPSITTETIGAYQVDGDQIFFGKVEGVDVQSGGTEFMGGPIEVSIPPTILNHGPLYWYLLNRGGKYGIRLKDTTASNRINFKGLDYFEISDKYKIEAKVLEPLNTDSIAITNVIGQVTNFPVEAYLNFEIAERVYDLVALDNGDQTYFVIFDDLTSGDTTYGGGRFLYPDKPCDTCAQVTQLDFNLAQNPPCAFTDFATCPLPPMPNKLKFGIKAGEKNASNH